MAIKVPIVTEFNKAGLSDAERAMRSFGVQSTTDLKKAAAGFGILAVAGAKAFSELDAGYDAIVTGTGATGDALKGLKSDADAVARTVPNSFEEVGIAVAEVNTRFGLTGQAAQDMSKRFLDLSRVAGVDVQSAIALTSRTFKDWGVETQDQALVLDKLYSATQASGISIEKLNESVVQFGAPLRQMGFSLDESIAMFAKFEAEGVNTEAVMSGLRQGLGRLSKAGEEPAEAFGRIVDEIKNVATTGEANKLAIETFGQRAGPDMAAAIREGRFELADMVAALDGAGGALETAAEETLSANDRFAMLKNQLMTAAVPAITLFAEVAEKLIGVLTLFPSEVQGAVVILGALAVASKSAGSAMKAFGVTMTSTATKTKIGSAALGVASVALVAYAAHQYAADKANKQFGESIELVNRATDEMASNNFASSLMAGAFAGKELDDTLASIAETSPGTIQRILDLEKESGALSTAFMANGASGEDVERVLAAMTVALEDEKVAIANAAATQELSTQITDEATGASEDHADAVEEVAQAHVVLDNKVAEATEAINESIEATRNLREERRRQADGTYDARDAEDDFHDSIDALISVQEDAESTEREKAAAIRNSVKATDEMISKQLEEQGVILDSERGQREWSASMLDSALFMGGPLGSEILAHIGRVNGIPEEKITQAQADLDAGSVERVRQTIDTELDKAEANPTVVPVGLEAARQRIQAILGRTINLSTSSSYVPPSQYGGRSHTGSRFEAGETKQIIPGQVFTPDTPGRLSSPGESKRMVEASKGGDTYNVTVNNNGRDVTADDIGRALRKVRLSS